MMIASFWETFWVGYGLGFCTLPALSILALMFEKKNK